MAQTHDRRSPLPMGSRLLNDEVLLDRNGCREWFFVPRTSWLVRHLRCDFALRSCSTFSRESHLGPSEGLHGPNLPNSLPGGNNMRERWETRGHATKVTDVFADEGGSLVGSVWREAYETNLDPASARERKKKDSCLRKSWFLRSRLSWRELPRSIDQRRPFPC